MTITPDDKDWTWVLEKRCDECDFDSTTVPATDVADLLRANAANWQALLHSPSAELRQRPRPDVWSPLEYACHVRDVFQRFRERVHLMLSEDDPLFANWDQDATAVEARYNEQDPATTSAELGDAAAALAVTFDAVVGDQWDRRGRRSDGASFTISTLSRYLVHDPIHHLYDATGERYAG